MTLGRLINKLVLTDEQFFKKHTPFYIKGEDDIKVFILDKSPNFCPLCNNRLIKYISFNHKVCYECNITIDWRLEYKQKPLISHQR